MLNNSLYSKHTQFATFPDLNVDYVENVEYSSAVCNSRYKFDIGAPNLLSVCFLSSYS